MEDFFKAIIGVLITIVLALTLRKQGKDISLLLVAFVCCAIVTVAVTYLRPVINFFRKLQSLGNLEPEVLRVVLKAVGIGLLAELTGLICVDSGNASMGKSLQILATAVILWLMLPLFTQLIDLIEEILGAV